MKEAELRDLLCENLSVLEEGLVLLKKEQYIPNHLGTRSFIDIYAKDKHNHHVLIEVKRSNEAAREAINEVIKYVEGVKIHLGARDDEIRVIIASTKWDELLVPYSRFVNETNISIIGLHLYIAEKKIISEKISVLNFNKGRFIAPWYDVYWYKNQNSLYHGIGTIKKDLISKNILDFIITIFKATTPIPSPSKERKIKIIQSFSGAIKNVPQELFDYIAIVSIQAKTTKEYISIIQSKDHSREELDDIFSFTEDMNEDEQLAYLHENAMESHDIDYDDFEIGYPAKVLAMMNNHNIQKEKIIRNGHFSRNKLLTDEIILSEVCGYSGNSDQLLIKNIETNNKAHLSTLKDDIETVLALNPVWKGHLVKIINEIEKSYPSHIVEFNLSFPCSGIFSLYYFLKNEDYKYLPSYFLTVKEKDGAILKTYFGFLQDNGIRKDFKEIIDTYYSGDLQELLFTVTWGGRDERDIDILEDSGLSYRSFCFNGTEKEVLYTLRDERWKTVKSADLSLAGYINNNESLIAEMISEISFFDQGDIFSAPEIDTHIIIERSEVEKKDISKLLFFFDVAISSKSAMRRFQGKIDLSFNGYDHDPELYEIKEIRDYAQIINQQIPHLFFFLNPKGACGIIKILYLCFCEVTSIQNNLHGKNYIHVNPNNIDILLNQQNLGIEQLAELCGASPELIKKSIDETLPRK